MVDYRALQKARSIMKTQFGESCTYDWGVELTVRYEDPLVWCYAIIVFLADWNWMYYKGKSSSEVVLSIMEGLCPLLKEVKDIILKFRMLKLDEIQYSELEDLKPIIVGLFNRMAKIVGFTGASKVLHLLAPSFFMMWDDKIREHYGVGADGDGYYEFLRKMRDEVREAIKSYSRERGIADYSKAREELEKNFSKPLLKVMDEYNYLTFTKKIKF